MTIYMHTVAIDEEKLHRLGYDTNAIPYDVAFDKEIILCEWDTPNRQLSSPVWHSSLHFRRYVDHYDDSMNSIIKICGGQDVSPIYRLDRNSMDALLNVFHKIEGDETIHDADKEAYNESLSLFAWAHGILDHADASNMHILIMLIPDM